MRSLLPLVRISPTLPECTRLAPDALPSRRVPGPRGHVRSRRRHLDMGHPCLEAPFFSTRPLKPPMRAPHPSNNHIITTPTSPPDAVRPVLAKNTLCLLEDRQIAQMHHLPTSQLLTHTRE